MIETILAAVLFGFGLGVCTVRIYDAWWEHRHTPDRIKWLPPHPHPPFKDRPKEVHHANSDTVKN